jgi:HEAT repeat protein
LIDLLSSDNADLRKASAGALGEIRASRAVTGLRALSHDPDVEVRKAAVRALEAIGRSSDSSEEN